MEWMRPYVRPGARLCTDSVSRQVDFGAVYVTVGAAMRRQAVQRHTCLRHASAALKVLVWTPARPGCWQDVDECHLKVDEAAVCRYKKVQRQDQPGLERWRHSARHHRPQLQHLRLQRQEEPDSDNPEHIRRPQHHIWCLLAGRWGHAWSHCADVCASGQEPVDKAGPAGMAAAAVGQLPMTNVSTRVHDCWGFNDSGEPGAVTFMYPGGVKSFTVDWPGARTIWQLVDEVCVPCVFPSSCEVFVRRCANNVCEPGNTGRRRRFRCWSVRCHRFRDRCLQHRRSAFNTAQSPSLQYKPCIAPRINDTPRFNSPT